MAEFEQVRAPGPSVDGLTPGASEAPAGTHTATTLATSLAITLAGCASLPAGRSTAATEPVPGLINGAELTPAQAARFLQQAAFAATPEGIAQVREQGLSAWLDAQITAPRTQGHVEWMLEKGYGEERYRPSFEGVDHTLWRKLFTSPDALRQRVALALSEIFVVSMQGLPVPWRGLMAAHYVDLLEAHAFGTYRELLEAITLSPAMGLYLNMRGNRRGDPATGRMPDENYAREVLQLFSIGLHELEEDGTPRLDRQGRPIETYGQDTVAGLARVFTGWNFDRFDRNRHDWVTRPMAFTPARHEPGPKAFLGRQIAAGTPGPQALQRALDAIAAHPNVGPFIGRQLIQRLVTSNPHPEHVQRVARVFADNGQGVRGDLAAVVRAVLLDPHARRDPDPTDPGWRRAGRLREPIERFIQWGRTFGANSNNGRWAIGATANPAVRLGQSPLRAPSVFNFFRPGYIPPNSALAAHRLQAPEFQLAHESSVIGWINFAQQFVAAGVADVRPDYRHELPLAAQADALVSHLNLHLTGAALSGQAQDLITRAVASMPAGTAAQQRQRVHAAVHLMLCSPDYLVVV